MFKRHTKPQPVLCGKPSDQPITVEELYEIAARAEEAHRKSSKTRALMEKLQPLISTITQYSKAFDVLVNTSSTVLSPLWGCLRILLAVSILEILNMVPYY